MDRKSIIILGVCFLLILCWEPILHKFYPVPIHPAGQANPAAPVSNPDMAQSPKAPGSLTNGLRNTLPSAAFHSDSPEELLVVSNANARYVFTSRGGGLKEVQLLHYPATVSSRRTKNRNTNDVATLNDSTLPPVFAIFGDETMPWDAAFKLTQTPDGVRAQKTFANGLSVTKDFQFTSNYLVNVSVKFENQSAQALSVLPQRWVAGAATPMDPLDNGLTGETVFWHNGTKSASVGLPYFNTNTSSFFGMFSREPKTLYLGGSNDVDWVSAQNQFFTLATMLPKPASALVVNMVELPPPSAEEIQANPATVRAPLALQASLLYPGFTLKAGQSATNNFMLFAGPKEYQVLAQMAARFNNDIDAIMSFSWAGPISKALLVTMNWLHSTLSLPYGWIIVLITFVIKMIFWPLTAASVRSSKRMQALQPQLKALQEKYKDDPQKATAKQWEFYKKNKVNPLSGCLPALLQVPVFIGFYGMLRGAIELRGAPFLWIGDLSKPDTVFSLSLLGYGFLPINPMPIIMGVTLLWGASMAPPSPSMDPAQQKMMKFMPLIMLAFMYNLSSGLALYWTVSNLLTVVQNKLTRAQSPDAGADNAPKSPAPTAPQKKKKD